MEGKASEYAAQAKMADAQAADTHHPEVRGSFASIAGIYRQMAETAVKLVAEDQYKRVGRAE
jgi:hypothetical protein